MTKIFVLIASLFLWTTIALAEPKAMNCAECRGNFPDPEACEPICGGAVVKGKKAKNLYNLLKDLKAVECTEGSCDNTLSGLSCTWKNGKKRSNFECSYQAGDTSKKVQGRVAQWLVEAAEDMGKAQSDCATGTCGLMEKMDMTCTELQSKPKKHECTVIVSLDSSKAAAKTIDGKAKAGSAAPGTK